MRIRIAVITLITALYALPAGASDTGPVRSGAGDRNAVEVTVYNDNLGLVKEVRTVSLPEGEGELRFMDVASHIQPSTVHVTCTEPSKGFAVLEQNYEYDLMNAQKLLDKYVGRQIRIVDWNRFQDRKDVVEATLLSNNQGQVYRIGDEIFLGHPGVKVLPELPENLIAQPTLNWLFRNDHPGPRKLQVSYLTENIRWRADYVLLLDAADRSADLSGWVTLDNQSGAAYTDARLKLVAGTVHRAPAGTVERDVMIKAMARAPAETFRQESFFEYHLYDLERPTTLKNRQTKQIRLLEANGIEVQKELLVKGSAGRLTHSYRAPTPRQPVSVFVNVTNEKTNNLGMPLPAGIVRVYKEDSRGSQQFIGEDRIQHTPEGETVRLKTGEAFDVVAERNQTDYRKVTKGVHESEWEITLRNHKKSAVRVGLVEALTGNWKVLSQSHPYRKTDAFTIRFDVEIPADGCVTVRYRVRVGL